MRRIPKPLHCAPLEHNVGLSEDPPGLSHKWEEMTPAPASSCLLTTPGLLIFLPGPGRVTFYKDRYG